MAQGSMLKTPWAKRGTTLVPPPNAPTSWKKAFPLTVNTTDIDVVAAAADYYLLEGVRYGIIVPLRVPQPSKYAEFLGGHDSKYNKWLDKTIDRPVVNVKTDVFEATKAKAEIRFQALVGQLAVVLRDYMHFAVASELAYHKAFRSAADKLNYSSGFDRMASWKLVVDTVGEAQACRDAATLFRDKGWNASYGGEPWAIGADYLAMFADGTMPAEMFIDRCWSLQHNTGSMLNKRPWKDNDATSWTVESLSHKLLPAHGAGIWTKLLKAASVGVRTLVNEHIEAVSQANAEQISLSVVSNENILKFNVDLLRRVFEDGETVTTSLMKSDSFDADNYDAIWNAFELQKSKIAYRAAKETSKAMKTKLARMKMKKLAAKQAKLAGTSIKPGTSTTTVKPATVKPYVGKPAVAPVATGSLASILAAKAAKKQEQEMSTLAYAEEAYKTNPINTDKCTIENPCPSCQTYLS